MNADLFEWRRAIASEQGPDSPVTRHVLLTLSLHMDAAGGSCFPTTKRLEAETGLSERVVCLHLRLAAESGWLEKGVKGQTGQGWKRSCYEAAIPEKALTQSQHLGGEGTYPKSAPSTKGTDFDDIKALTQSQSSSSVNSSKESLEKNPEKEIEEFKARYSSQSLIEEAFKAIASTRRSGRVADSVMIAQLKKWERYPVDHVIAGIRTYLDKDCAGDGKGEAYLLGIIRGVGKRNGSGGKSPANINHSPPREINHADLYAN